MPQDPAARPDGVPGGCPDGAPGAGTRAPGDRPSVQRRRQLALARETVRRSRPRPVLAAGGARVRSPASRWTCRTATSTGPSTTSSPSRSRPPPSPAPGCASASPGSSWTGSCWSGRTPASTPGVLARLVKVVSAEPVLTAELARLARAVADRWAGTLADVLRLALPPRHAGAEAEPAARARSRPARPGARAPGPPTTAGRPTSPPSPAGAAARAVATALPGADWPRGARHRRRGDPRRRARRARGRARRPRPGPGRRRALRARRSGRAAGQRTPGAERGPRARGALPPVAGRAPRHGPRGRRHPGRDVRAGGRPRAGGDLGRRRRPARRAARPLPARAGGAVPAGPPRSAPAR